MPAPMASRLLLLAGLTFALGVPLAAQDSAHAAGHGHDGDPDHAVAGGGAIPAGWTARADDHAGTANVKVAPMGGGMHVTLGPAVILYQAKHDGKGSFHTLATFTQTKKVAHPEGYGLFYGGKALAGDGEKYVYFLIRQDGKYLVKQRDGDKTTEITKGWVASPAVKQLDAKGTATNKLEIDNKSDPTKVRFLVNGQEVHSMAAKPGDTDGQVGLRVNHNLDLHIDGFDVHR